MIRSAPHKKSSIHAYVSLLAISLIGGLFGLTQVATADSSAASPHTNASRATAGEFRAAYSNTLSPRLRELDQVLQQRSVSKISSTVLTQTADGASTPIV